MDVDGFYLKQATEIVDGLFDNGYFAKECSRDDMRKIDELFAFYLQSAVTSALTCERLTRKVRERDGE